MIELSLDMAFRNTGIVVFKANEIIHHDCIKTSDIKKVSVFDNDKRNYLYLLTTVRQLIESYKPNVIYFEKLSGSSQNSRAGKLLAYARSILFVLELLFPNVKFVPVTTAESKKVVKANATKHEIMDYVRDNYTYFDKFFEGKSRIPNHSFEHISDACVIRESKLIK